MLCTWDASHGILGYKWAGFLEVVDRLLVVLLGYSRGSRWIAWGYQHVGVSWLAWPTCRCAGAACLNVPDLATVGVCLGLMFGVKVTYGVWERSCSGARDGLAAGEVTGGCFWSAQ